MAILTTQRFIAGLTVFDTYNGQNGTIVQMNLDSGATTPLAPLYVGAYFVVVFTNGDQAVFTIQGRRLDPLTGVPLVGVTLITSNEKTALLASGYPSV